MIYLISTTFTVSPSTSNHLRFPNKVQSIKLSCSKYSCFFLNKKPVLTRLWRAKHSSKFHGTPKRRQRGAVWLTARRHRASAPAHSVGLAGAAAGAPRACACAPAAPAPCAPSPGGVSGRPASHGRIGAPRAPAAPALPVRTALDHRALAPCRRRVEAARAHELQQCGQRPGVGSERGGGEGGGSLALKVHLVTSKGQPLVEAGCAGPRFKRGTLDRPFAGDTDGAYHSLLLTLHSCQVICSSLCLQTQNCTSRNV